ncbi:MAG: hypothetical protein GF320_16325 [Armatimonadia bacterium]|nr:hypothetical protein [Armatimonadia bacterium]
MAGLVVHLSTGEARLLAAEPFAPRALVCVELAKPHRPKSDVCRRVTLVGRVIQCEKLGRRDSETSAELPGQIRPAASLLIEVLSTDECLQGWLSDLQDSQGRAKEAPSARAV